MQTFISVCFWVGCFILYLLVYGALLLTTGLIFHKIRDHYYENPQKELEEFHNSPKN